MERDTASACPPLWLDKGFAKEETFRRFPFFNCSYFMLSGGFRQVVFWEKKAPAAASAFFAGAARIKRISAAFTEKKAKNAAEGKEKRKFGKNLLFCAASFIIHSWHILAPQ